MLSLLSDEYRGKTQGLRIGALSCEIKEVKAETIEPIADGTNTLTIKDQSNRDFIVVNGPQDQVDFQFAAKFQSGIYTDTFYPYNTQFDSGEIQSAARSLNLLNTHQFYEYRGLPDIGSPFGTFGASVPLPASNLPSPTLERSNFEFPFTTNNGGWTCGVTFNQDPVYQVTFSITGKNTNHAALLTLASYDSATNTKKDYIARGVMDSGVDRSATVTGTWVYDPLFPTIALVIYSPQGGTTIEDADLNVTFTRMF